MPSKPRTMTIAHLVHYYATRAEWNMSLQELSDTISEYMNEMIPVNMIRGICQSRKKGGVTWLHLLRCASPRNDGIFSNGEAT
jgi:hypothetical protein